MTSKDAIKAQNVIKHFLEESYTLTEAASLIGVTKQLLSQEFKNGRLDGMKLGRDVWISKDDLYRYLYKRSIISNTLRLLQMNGYGKTTLDDLVKYLDSLES